jgi:hypothetical protein
MNYIPALIETLRSKLQPWRAYVIATDGRDGVGKSPLGRKLAFDLHVPLVETDLFLVPENSEPIHLLIQKQHHHPGQSLGPDIGRQVAVSEGLKGVLLIL